MTDALIKGAENTLVPGYKSASFLVRCIFFDALGASLIKGASRVFAEM